MRDSVGRFGRRLRAAMNTSRLEREMDEEMRHHLEMEAAELVRSGVAPDEAWRRARVAFGGVELHKEAGRDARGVRWLDDLARDLKYGLRQLRRSPGFTIASLVTLALGIGASTAMYSMVRALATPFPFAHLDGLVFLEQCGPGCRRMAIGNYVTVRNETRTLSEVGAMMSWSPTYRGPERTDVLRAARVTESFFRTVGVRAALGRTFLPDDTLPGRPHVVVLSEASWRTRFGADSSVLGRSMTLDGSSHTIVGVLANRHTVPPLTELWGIVPLDAKAVADRSWTDYQVFGRLRPGVTLAEADAEVATIGRRLAIEFPDPMARQGLNARALADWNETFTRPTVTFVTAVGFVLVIACINLAGLLLARLTARDRELAVRAAMGAGSGRIARQLLTETFILSLAGGALGMLSAAGIVRLIRTASPADMMTGLPGWAQIGTDIGALAVALFLGAATGALIGLGPALRFSRPDLTHALKEGARGTGGRGTRIRRTLVVAEVAFALVLLAAAGLLARSTINIYSADLGFRRDGVLTMRLRYSAEPDSMRRRPPDFYDRLVDEIRRIPGVDRASVAASVPLTGFTFSGFEIDGRPSKPDERASALMQAVTPGYFQTLDIPIRQGRGFEPRDDAMAPRVAVINERVARRLFLDKGEQPLGRALRIDDERYEIVGVAADIYHTGVEHDPWLEIYRVQQQWPRREVSLVVRGHNDPVALTGAVTRTIREFDADIGVTRIQTMEQLLAQRLGRNRVIAISMSLFAAIALMISAMGLYGVISYSVAQRTREFGIRLALGAGRRELLGLVLGDGIRLMAIGSGVGLAGAFALTRLMSFLLYGIGPNDPVTLVGVVVTLGAIAVGASFVPARRATRVDPLTSLRAE